MESEDFYSKIAEIERMILAFNPFHLRNLIEELDVYIGRRDFNRLFKRARALEDAYISLIRAIRRVKDEYSGEALYLVEE